MKDLDDEARAAAEPVLAYGTAQDRSSWHAVVRLLSILVLISGATGLVMELTPTGIMHVGGLSELMAAIHANSVYTTIQLSVSLAAMIVNGLLIIGGTACLSLREKMRQLVVVGCLLRIALLAINTLAGIWMYVYPYPQYVQRLVPQRIVGAVSSSLFPLAVAVIFSLPAVRVVFREDGEGR